MNKIILLIFILLGLTASVFFVSASTGTINSTNKYAWSNNIGWINFGCSSCNVQVTNDAITGYAWSKNYGWINLSPTNGGIHNTSAGVLSGYAYGKSCGWINFNNVTIDTSTGKFSGTATGSIVGTVNFSCTEAGCPVTTDWRPATVTSCGDGACNGTEKCSSCPADCGSCSGGFYHNECNAQKQCVSVSGQAVDQCSSASDCGLVCSTDSDCGTNNYIDSLFCQDGNVYQNYITYTCNNAGLANSACSNATEAKLKTTCSDNESCNNGSCVNPNVACTVASDCGTNSYDGPAFCKNNDLGNIYQNYITYTCSNAGTESSSCSNSTEPNLITACPFGQTCANGICVNPNASHNECNNQKQCISVSGAGTDQCQSSSDCETPNQIIIKPIETITTIATIIEEQIPPPVKVIVQQTKKIINTTTGSIVTKTVSTTGLLVTTIAAASSFSLFDILFILLRLFDLLLITLGLKKKVLPWGVVYDSITKQPLDPAYVILKDLKGKEIASAITDLDGRYGFLVEPGVYQIEAHKTNYDFPSKKLAGKTQDELYNNLYFSENIEVKKSGEVITKNIPLDPIKFDWNEFAKKKNNLMKFYSKWTAQVGRIYDFLFAVGFVIAVISYIFAPYPYNMIVAILYVVFLILRFLGLKPRAYGYVFEKSTGNPLSFAIIRAMLPNSEQQVASKACDKYGKYYCLVPPGKYYVKVEKKIEDGSYALVYTSQVIDVSKKGIIKEGFKV